MSAIVEIESISVRLGERDFEVKTAGFARSKPWKKRLIDDVKPLFEEIGLAADFKIDEPGDLLRLIPLLEILFLDGIETIFDLLIAYSPALEAEREYIEAHSTDKQILAAFQGVLKLADPFGVVQMMGRRIGL